MPPLFPLSQQKERTVTTKLPNRGCGYRPVFFVISVKVKHLIYIFRSRLKQLEESSRVAATELESKRDAALRLQQLHKHTVEAEMTARELKNKALADEAAALEDQVKLNWLVPPFLPPVHLMSDSTSPSMTNQQCCANDGMPTRNKRVSGVPHGRNKESQSLKRSTAAKEAAAKGGRGLSCCCGQSQT